MVATATTTQRDLGRAPYEPARLELTVLVVSSIAATVTRFVALKVWVFAGARDSRQEDGASRERIAPRDA